MNNKQIAKERKIEIVTKQIKYCEGQLKKEGSDVEFLTNQLNLRRQLRETFQNHQTEAV